MLFYIIYMIWYYIILCFLVYVCVSVCGCLCINICVYVMNCVCVCVHLSVCTCACACIFASTNNFFMYPTRVLLWTHPHTRETTSECWSETQHPVSSREHGLVIHLEVQSLAWSKRNQIGHLLPWQGKHLSQNKDIVGTWVLTWKKQYKAKLRNQLPPIWVQFFFVWSDTISRFMSTSPIFVKHQPNAAKRDHIAGQRNR